MPRVPKVKPRAACSSPQANICRFSVRRIHAVSLASSECARMERSSAAFSAASGSGVGVSSYWPDQVVSSKCFARVRCAIKGNVIVDNLV